MKNTFQPTPYQDLNEVLSILVKNLKEILQDNLVGIYLQGSFAVGDFDENSDCDFIVATHEEISEEKTKELEKIHKQIFKMKSPWGQHLEGSYFSKEILKNTKHINKEVWYLDHGSTNIERSDHCNKVHVRWVLWNKGVVLFGSDPKDLIEEIQIQELKKEIYDTIQSFGKEVTAPPEEWSYDWDTYCYQCFIVLNFCRMLHDLKSGTNGSKRAGAEWVKKNLDPKWRELIDKSWGGRIDPATTSKQESDPKDFAKTQELVKVIMEESKKYYP